jgi:pimeloyl-ACP methyl ester carboxylesterase
MHDEAAVLPAVVAAARLEGHILVGHSDGASIALLHAGSSGDRRLRGLVLLAPHVFCEERSIQGIEAAAKAWRETDLRARLARHHGANVDCAFLGWNRAWLDPGFRRWNIEECLSGIRVPVLALQGEDDEYGTMAQVDAIARQVRGPVEVMRLARCGHAPERDRPEETLAAIEAFVRGRALVP